MAANPSPLATLVRFLQHRAKSSRSSVPLLPWNHSGGCIGDREEIANIVVVACPRVFDVTGFPHLFRAALCLVGHCCKKQRNPYKVPNKTRTAVACCQLLVVSETLYVMNAMLQSMPCDLFASPINVLTVVSRGRPHKLLWAIHDRPLQTQTSP